jgi:hypothetical protein
MMLLILLAIPLVVASAGIALSKGRFNWLEASIQAAVGLALMGGGYMVARYAKTVDTEIWNGRIAAKDAGTQGCCHSYSCNCIPVCSSDSNGNQTCVDVCSTCYEHDHDVYWSASTTNGESVFSDTCNPPGTQAPEAWERIRMGEPTAIEHTYINYIKGLPGKFFRRPWLVERYRSRLPSYPRVRGYSASRFLTSLGESLPDSEVLEQGLAELNADLGKARQVNIIVVVVGDESPEYADALAEAWLGGKKNDLIVVVGVPENLRVGWAKVVSWTDARGVRDGIEQRVAEAKGKAEAAVAEAEGRAKAKRAVADAEAYYNSTVAKSITPALIQYESLHRWNGTLPVYLGGGSPMPFVQVKGK